MVRFNSSFPEHQVYEDWIDLHPSAARTGPGTGTRELALPENTRAIIACLDVTVAAAGDTIDVKIQTLVRQAGLDAVSWVDVIAFTQVGIAAERHYDKIVAGLDQADFLNANLAAGNKRHLFGSLWRCVWDINVAGPYTFSVTLQPM